MSVDNSPTEDWPSRYRASFRSDRFLAYRAAMVLLMVGIVGSARNIVIACSVILIAGIVGVGFAAAMGFEGPWPIIVALPFVVVLVGVTSAVISYPRRSTLYEQYRPGTEVKVASGDGRVGFSLNGQRIQYLIVDVRRVWRVGKLSAVEFADGKCVVLPNEYVPQNAHPDSAGAPDGAT